MNVVKIAMSLLDQIDQMSKNERFFLFLIIFISVFSTSIGVLLGLGFQVALVFSPALLTVSVLVGRGLPRTGPINLVYFLFLYWAFLCIVSVLVSSQEKHLIQLGVYVFLPFTLLLVGYKLPVKNIESFFYGAMLLVSSFVLLERLEFYSVTSATMVSDFSSALRSFGEDTDYQQLFGRATGLFANPNEFGFFALGSVLILLALGSVQQAVADFSVAKKTLLLLFLIAGFLSFSRGATLSMLIALLLTSIIFRAGRFLVLFGGLGFVFLAFVIFLLGVLSEDARSLWFARFGGGAEGFAVDQNLSGRVQFWKSVLSGDHLIFGVLVSPESYFGHAIDSLFVRWLGWAGVFGVLSIFVLFGLCLYVAVNLKVREMSFYFLAFFLFVLFNSFVMLSILSPSGGALFWLGLGCLLKINSLERYL